MVSLLANIDFTSKFLGSCAAMKGKKLEEIKVVTRFFMKFLTKWAVNKTNQSTGHLVGGANWKCTQIFPSNSKEIPSPMSTGGRPVVDYWQKLVDVVKERPFACFVMCCVLSQTFLQIAGVVTHACFAYLLCFYANISRSCKAFTLLCKFYMLLSVTKVKGAFLILNVKHFCLCQGKIPEMPFFRMMFENEH